MWFTGESQFFLRGFCKRPGGIRFFLQLFKQFGSLCWNFVECWGCSLKIINLWVVFRVGQFPGENCPKKKLQGETLLPASCNHSPNACGLRLSCRSFSAAACPFLPCQRICQCLGGMLLSLLRNAERFSESGHPTKLRCYSRFNYGMSRERNVE